MDANRVPFSSDFLLAFWYFVALFAETTYIKPERTYGPIPIYRYARQTYSKNDYLLFLQLFCIALFVMVTI